jgi:hypothetical protein
MNTVRQANVVGTGRYETAIHPVVTQVTLAGDRCVCIKIDGVIRTGLLAGQASGATVFIQNHDAVRTLDDGAFRTGPGAGWLVAVATEVDPVLKLKGVPDHLGSVFFHGNQFQAWGKFELLFAGNFTGFAAPAFFMLDDDGVSVHRSPP